MHNHILIMFIIMRKQALNLVVALLAFSPLSAIAQGSFQCNEVFISEYIEGSNNNDLIELFNPSDSIRDLSNYSLAIYPDGSTNPVLIDLFGSLNPRETFVVSHPSASSFLSGGANLLTSILNYDGNDAIALLYLGIRLDVIGEIGVNPGAGGWTVYGQSSTTSDNLRRKYHVQKGSLDWMLGQDEWQSYVVDSNFTTSVHDNICTCEFSNASVTEYFIKGQSQLLSLQDDIYIFRLQNGGAYTGQAPSYVDSVIYQPGRGMQYNLAYFNPTSSAIERLNFKETIRLDNQFELEFKSVTLNPSLNYSSQLYFTSSDLLNVVFRNPSPSTSEVQSFADRYGLSVIHTPSPNLPVGGNNSWTHQFRMDQRGCKARDVFKTSYEMYANDSLDILIAEPWLEPTDLAYQMDDPLKTAFYALPESTIPDGRPLAARELNSVGVYEQGNAASNDPYYPNQWHIENIGQCLGPSGNSGTPDADADISEAWNAGYTGSQIRVAVIDKGVYNLNHPDISSHYVNGYDFIDNDSDITSCTGTAGAHGQAVSGLIAATGNNNLGTVGVAYDAAIYPYITWFGSSSVAFQQACLENVHLINCSWGWYGNFNASIENEIQLCRDLGRGGKGILTIAAAGNDFRDNGILTDKSFPASLPSVVGVIASDPDDSLKKPGSVWDPGWGSNYGTGFNVAAPGTHVISTDLMGSSGFNLINSGCIQLSNLNPDYTFFNGTSASAPIATGVCVLIFQQDTNYTADQVQDILENSAEKVSYSYNQNGFSNELAYGRVNAYRALVGRAEQQAELSSRIRIKVFPNPSMGDLYLVVESDDRDYLDVAILDLSGKLLVSCLDNESIYPGQSFKFDLSSAELPAGIYLLSIKTQTQRYTQRLIIAK